MTNAREGWLTGVRLRQLEAGDDLAWNGEWGVVCRMALSALDLQAELSEQCRLLGMSGEREASLKARAGGMQELLMGIQNERDILRAQLEAAKAQLTAQPDGVDWRKLAEDAWNGWRIGKDIVTPMHALRDALAAAPAREDGVKGFTFEDAMRIVRGAIDVYGGGYSGEERKAFTAGIQTAFNCLDGARRSDTQTAANLRIGTQALAAPAPACETCGDCGEVTEGVWGRRSVQLNTKPCPDCSKEKL